MRRTRTPVDHPLLPVMVAFAIAGCGGLLGLMTAAAGMDSAHALAGCFLIVWSLVAAEARTRHMGDTDARRAAATARRLRWDYRVVMA